MKKLLFLLPFLIFLDLYIKYLAVNFLPLGGIYLFKDWLGLELFYNENIAFSIPISKYFIIVLNTIIIMVLMYILFLKMKEKGKVVFYQVLAITVLLAGAIANLLDRLYNGFVIDYIVLGKFPVFNLADMMVVSGTLFWLMLEYYVEKRKVGSRSSMDRTIPS